MRSSEILPAFTAATSVVGLLLQLLGLANQNQIRTRFDGEHSRFHRAKCILNRLHFHAIGQIRPGKQAPP